jgi:hypothetical protein
MKFNLVFCLIALGIGALAGYGFYDANSAPTDIPLLSAIVGGLCIFVPLAGLMAVTTTGAQGGTANIRMVSLLFEIILIIEQIIFVAVPFHAAPYIVVSGGILLIYLSIAYGAGLALKKDRE